MSEFHLKLWNDFCKAEKIQDSPLIFDADANLIVTVKTLQRGHKIKVLKRTNEMEDDLSSKAIEVRKDAESESPTCQGLLYMMFRKKDQMVIPLYIGKAEKGGRKHEISRLFTNKKNRPLPRWDDSKPYHIGGLSTWVCNGYDPRSREKTKEHWAQALFEDIPSDHPKLRWPVYLWVRIWRNSDVGFWQEYGPTSMCMHEGMLIDIASRLYPGDLLNTEGILR